jgi:Flp pilus assembly protein TadG
MNYRRNYRRKNRLLRFFARQDGSIAVEFVILFPLFVLVLMGILEFGHLWYVDHVITNASREGARAAVVYVAEVDRQAWAESTATTAVTNYIVDPVTNANRLPGVSWTVSPTATGGNSGDSITVTVAISDAALLLDLLNIPGFTNLPLTAATTMRME